MRGKKRCRGKSSLHERGGGQVSETDWGDKVSYTLRATSKPPGMSYTDLVLLPTLDAPKCGRKTAMFSPREELSSMQEQKTNGPTGKILHGI